MQSRHSKLFSLRVPSGVPYYETLLFVQPRHSKLYCLCSPDIRNFIVCATEVFETLWFVQSSHSKLYCLRVPSGAPYFLGVYLSSNVFGDRAGSDYFSCFTSVMSRCPQGKTTKRLIHFSDTHTYLESTLRWPYVCKPLDEDGTLV